MSLWRFELIAGHACVPASYASSYASSSSAAAPTDDAGAGRPGARPTFVFAAGVPRLLV